MIEQSQAQLKPCSFYRKKRPEAVGDANTVSQREQRPRCEPQDNAGLGRGGGLSLGLGPRVTEAEGAPPGVAIIRGVLSVILSFSVRDFTLHQLGQRPCGFLSDLDRVSSEGDNLIIVIGLGEAWQ